MITTGCWDMVEINERIFPYDVGVDLNEGEGGGYIITMTYPNMNAIGKNATQQETVFVVSTPATSIFEGSKRLSTIAQYPFYFKHLRVLVIGEELGKDGHKIRQIIDGLSRDFIINKKLLIATADGRAEDILKAVPKASKQKVINGTLFTLLQNNKSSSRFRTKSLTDFIQGIDQGSVIVPRIRTEGEDLKVFGGCIFKDYVIIGHIGEIESRAISFLKGEVKEELIDAPYKGTVLSYALTGQSMKKKLIKTDGNLKMKIDIETEGSLQEFIITDHPESHGEAAIEEMQKAIESVLSKEINNSLEILQQKYKSDAIGIGDYISKFHPKIWKEISKDWDEVFSEMDIEVNLTTKIRRRGLMQ